MIGYQDFKKTSNFGALTKDSFQTAMVAANEWISLNKINVINVETLCDTSGFGGISATSQEGVRIWYRNEEANQKNIPVLTAAQKKFFTDPVDQEHKPVLK